MTSLNLVGFVCALLPSLLVGALFSRKSDVGASDTKLRELERELETTKAELYVQHEALASLKSQAEKNTEQIKTRDAKIAELESKLELADNAKFAAESGVDAANSRTEALKSETDTLRARLAEAEAEMESLRSKLTNAEAERDNPKPNPAMVAEIESLRKTVLSQNNDVATLLNRVKELAPLKLQITDRDLRLRKLEAKLAEATKNEQAKIEEAARLAQQLAAFSESKEREKGILADRVAELEATAAEQATLISQLRDQKAEYEFALREKDSQLADLQSQLNSQSIATEQDSTLRDKDAAISLLQLRVKELEPLAAQVAERDLKLRQMNDDAAETEVRLRHLQNRLEETEALAVSSSADELIEAKMRELELRQQELQAALADKDAEIARLKSLVASSPDNAHARVEAAEAKAEELDAEFNAELTSRDEEIARLQARIAELEPLHAQLFARDARLIELEARLESAISEKESEAKHLNARIAELEPAGALAEAAEAKLRELEKQHQATVNNLEVEISGLRVKLAGLEGINAVLNECMDKLREAETRLQSLEADRSAP